MAFRFGLAAAFALLTVIATFLPVPMPFVTGQVPSGDGISLLWKGPTFAIGLGVWSIQVEAVLLAPLVLGARLGTLSQLIYVLAGLSGWPLFYHGGGLGMLAGPTGGFLLGVVPACLVTGWLARRRGGWIQHWQASVAGLLILQAGAFMGSLGRVGITWQRSLSTLVLWPMQGHVVLLLALTFVTALVATLVAKPQREAFVRRPG